MGDLSDFQIGQTVELHDGRTAKVQFVGNAHFASGDWLGVELEDASGKNDGAVQGQRYFNCEPGHGMFVRPASTVVLEQPTPKPNGRAYGRPNGAAPKSRPQSMAAAGSRRQTILDTGIAKRQSINAGSPTPGTRAVPNSKLGSPSKSPTKQLSSISSSRNATSPRTTTSATQNLSAATSRASRPSMGPPSALSANPRSSRQSIVGTSNGAARVPGQISTASSRAPTKRLSIRPDASKNISSASGESQVSASSGQGSPTGSLEAGLLSPKSTESQDQQATKALSSTLSRASVPTIPHGFDKPTSSRVRSPHSTSQRGQATNTTSIREAEDLKTKLRIMEKKRIEDREKLKNLEKIQAERDKFEGIIQKLQSKYQPQQQEISNLKTQLKEAAARFSVLEAQQAEIDIVVEGVTLDREMAEETAESLKMELENLRQEHEEIELEVEILREENQELGKEMSPEEKTSQGWLQMERSNERLREALMRLRDMTQQQEADLKDHVAELEKDLQDLGTIKEEYLQTKEKLVRSESIVENLRQQLDTALGADEMIEELTDKNFALNEQLNDLKVAVEDLESLKELNDELDINHTENEKQLQEEIDCHEMALAEQSRKSNIKDETIHDLEYTVSRFRDLVTNMQNDLEDLRASQQITESEANDMTSRSRAMMDLNMRLQVSASKAQVKAIDLELRRLEAQEAAEHLKIIQLFLPETFKAEHSSVLAFLSFRRIGFKANMMHGFVKDRVNGQAPPGQEEGVLVCYDILDKLVWLSSTCDRFVSFIQTSTLEAFGRLEGALYELEPVERAFNVWIDCLKRDEFKEDQCAMELQRSIALMTHLGEIHISEGLEQYADDIHMRASMMQSHLENTAAALSQVKTMSQNKLAPSGEIDEVDQEMQDFLRKADSLVTQTRSAKVIVSKAIRQLEELKLRSLTLDQSTLPSIEQSQNSASELASATRTVGLSLSRLLNEEGRNSPFTYQEISLAISTDAQPFSSLSSKIQTTTAQVQKFYNLSNSLTQTVEFASPPPSPPWQLLAQKMRAASATSAAQEIELGRLKDNMAERKTAIALRDKIVEEMSVKIEILEKRAGESGGRREKVQELEAIVDAAKEKEKSLLAHLMRQQLALQDLETERKTWKKSSVQNHLSTNSRLSQIPADSASSLRKIATLESEIRALQSSIRYLRSTSNTHELSTSLAFLYTPLLPQPPPDPSSALKSEAVDVLKELLHLVSRPDNGLLSLRASERDERLKWKPAKETSAWVLARQRREWEGWREWGESVGRKGERTRKEWVRRKGDFMALEKGIQEGETIAKMEIKQRLGMGWSKVGDGREVRIAIPGEWEDLQRLVGVDTG